MRKKWYSFMFYKIFFKLYIEFDQDAFRLSSEYVGITYNHICLALFVDIFTSKP